MIYKIKQLYKKWWFQLILIAVPLIIGLIGYIKYYSVLIIKNELPWTFITPITSTLKLFASYVDAKPNKNLNITGFEWYMIFIVVARILAILTTGNLVFRLLHPIIKHITANHKFGFRWKKYEQILLIGNNEENRCIYRSIKKGNIKPMILCPSEEEFQKLYDDGIDCIYLKPDEAVKSILKDKLSNDKSRCTIIINTKNDEKNLEICGTVVDCVKGNLSRETEIIDKLRNSGNENDRKELISKEKKAVEKLDRIRVMAFGDKHYETAYQKMEQDSFGILRYTNKARKIAMDLIVNHPLTSFIGREHYANEYACLNKTFDINVIFIGFGNMNQELFSASTVINQFIEGDKGEIPYPKKVNYYIYDKENFKARNLNHQIFRYKNEFLFGIKNEIYNPADYLEIPPDPTACSYVRLDVNSPGFYESLWSICTERPDSLNVFYVALGSDLDNIDVAQKLSEKTGEWKVSDTRIFVNISNGKNYRIMNSSSTLIPFGSENEIVYDYGHIFSNELEEMARKKHYMNALIKSGKGNGLKGTPEEIEIDSLYEWYTYDAIKKQSSLFSILSLRSKLQMMGLDYRKKKEHAPSLKSNDAYFRIYAKDDRPELDPNFERIYGKNIYRYHKCLEKEDLTRQSLRQNLAIQEHYRWNAFMIRCGFIPASIKEIVNDKVNHGKDYKTRTHGNLTTVAGLIDFRKLAADPAKPEYRADVLNYDFHLMDDVWWYLDMFGYEIFER